MADQISARRRVLPEILGWEILTVIANFKWKSLKLAARKGAIGEAILPLTVHPHKSIFQLVAMPS